MGTSGDLGLGITTEDGFIVAPKPKVVLILIFSLSLLSAICSSSASFMRI